MDKNIEPRFSVVIPCYNRAGFLVRCLSAIAKQSFDLERVEVVVVDDASTDGSGVILERLGSDFPNFKLVQTCEPSGPGGARNRGVKDATGEYLFFIDSDDFITPKALERIDAKLEEAKNPDVCIFPFRIDRPVSAGRPIGVTKPSAINIQQAAAGAVSPCLQVFKRKLFVPFPDGTLSEDTAWHFLQFDRFETFAKVEGDEPCYVYDRTNTKSITDTVDWAANNSFTLEQLAFGNAALKAGKNDRWISDFIRNFANMYDTRHKLTKPGVKQAWAHRFRAEIVNLMTGHFVH